MATLDNRYTINGLVDTSRTALENMTAITNSCNTWLSYDALIGKWSVVMNRAGDSEYSFDDSNILGPVNLTTTSLTGYYNSCEVRFHNIALRDREDYVLLEIPANQRLPNEPDNRLIINAPMVNNQIQAQLLGLIELKQSRLDKVIEFNTDYSYINVPAGSIISVTNSVYGWTNKLFRVLTMTESNNETIAVTFRAQEYDDNIYDDADLYLYLRDTEDGLIELDPLTDTSAVTTSTAVVDADTGEINPLIFTLPLLLKLLDGVNAGQGNQMTTGIFDGFTAQTGKNLTTAQILYTYTDTITGNNVATKLAAMTAGADQYGTYDQTNVTNRANMITFQFYIPAGYTTATFEIQSPTVRMEYYTLVNGTPTLFTDTYAQPPFSLAVRRGANLATATSVATSTVDWTSNYSRLVVNSPSENTYWVTMYLLPTYDLNTYWPTRVNPGQQPNLVYFINFTSVGPASCTTTVAIQ
jgi:hypothetical protein